MEYDKGLLCDQFVFAVETFYCFFLLFVLTKQMLEAIIDYSFL